MARITVITSYGNIDIVDLKNVYVNEYLGTYRLMYTDKIYEYNCIYWSFLPTSIREYEKKKQKILEAYNRGDKIVSV